MKNLEKGIKNLKGVRFIVHLSVYNGFTENKNAFLDIPRRHSGCRNKYKSNGEIIMEFKYAVALLKGDDEKIMAIFDTKEEADAYGFENKVSHEEGLQYCFASMFLAGVPQGNNMRIYDYYNVKPVVMW